MVWAFIMCVVLAALVVFQLALACGAPWGRFAWGGQHDGALPMRLRVASALSTLMYVFIGVLALSRVGVAAVFPPGFSAAAMWVVFGYLCLGVLMNTASRSRPERAVMTPVAVVLAACALGVALS